MTIARPTGLLGRRRGRESATADRTALVKRAESGKPADRAAVRKALLHAQQDVDFVAVRDAEGLVKLPVEERLEWEKLWKELADQLKQLNEVK